MQVLDKVQSAGELKEEDHGSVLQGESPSAGWSAPGCLKGMAEPIGSTVGSANGEPWKHLPWTTSLSRKKQGKPFPGH